MFKIFVSFIVFGALISFAENSQGPSYRCTHSSKRELHIWFVDKKSGGIENSNWKLSGYRAFLDEPRQQIEIHFFNNPNGFVEVREQFVQKKGKTNLELTILDGNQILRGWQCRYLGADVDTALMESISSIGRGDGLWLKRAAKGIGYQKLLGTDSVSVIERLVKRYCFWIKSRSEKNIEQELRKVFQSMNYLSIEASKQVEDQLSNDSDKKCWRGILEQIAYDKFPPLQRWVFWASLANNGNQEALRISIREFLKSPIANEKDMVTFYQSEIRTNLKKLSKAEIERVASQGLSEQEKKFLDNLWKTK